MNAVNGEAAALSSAIDIGLVLKQRREEKNFLLEGVASELRLTPHQLLALESGRFSEFRSAVFVKGHLRNCAKLYGIDGDVLVRAYERIAPKVDKEVSTPARAKIVVISTPNPYRKYSPVIALLLVLLVAGGYWQWISRSSQMPQPIIEVAESEAVPASEEAQLNNIDAAEDILSSSTTTTLIDQSPLQITPLAAAPLNEAAVSAVENSNAVNDQKTVENDQLDSALHIEFSDDCWVQIKSHNGKIVHEKKIGRAHV